MAQIQLYLGVAAFLQLFGIGTSPCIPLCKPLHCHFRLCATPERENRMSDGMHYDPNNPLIVQGDRTVLVEVDNPKYAEARDALAHLQSWRNRRSISIRTD